MKLDLLVVESSVHWYGHVLRRGIDIEVEGQRKKCKLKWTLKKQVEERGMKIGFSMEDTLCRSKWYFGVIPIATRLSQNRPPSRVWDIS